MITHARGSRSCGPCKNETDKPNSERAAVTTSKRKPQHRLFTTRLACKIKRDTSVIIWILWTQQRQETCRWKTEAVWKVLADVVNSLPFKTLHDNYVQVSGSSDDSCSAVIARRTLNDSTELSWECDITQARKGGWGAAERFNRNISDMKSSGGLLHVVLQELQGDSGLGLWSVDPLVEEYSQLKVMCHVMVQNSDDVSK